MVNLRAIQQGKATKVKAEQIGRGRGDAAEAVTQTTTIYFEGKNRKAKIYDRSKLKSGHKIAGPAIVEEMDSTTLILPDHEGTVDNYGNILIRPAGMSAGKTAARSGAKKSAAATKRPVKKAKPVAKKAKAAAKKAKPVAKKAKSAKAKKR